MDDGQKQPGPAERAARYVQRQVIDPEVVRAERLLASGPDGVDAAALRARLKLLARMTKVAQRAATGGRGE